MTFEEWAAYTIGFVQGFAFFIFFAIVVYIGGRIHGWRERPRSRSAEEKPKKKEVKEL